MECQTCQKSKVPIPDFDLVIVDSDLSIVDVDSSIVDSDLLIVEICDCDPQLSIADPHP